MLRECCRIESLTKILLYDDSFYRFFDYVELSTFDIASDAFSTFKVKTNYIHCMCCYMISGVTGVCVRGSNFCPWNFPRVMGLDIRISVVKWESQFVVVSEPISDNNRHTQA